MDKRKALLIIPKYYGYEDKIIDAFVKLGYDVDYIFENLPSISYYYRFVNVYFPQFIERAYERYYYKALDSKSRKKYDVILVIRGQTISTNVLNSIKKQSPEAKLILYQWDSVRNNPNAEIIAGEFDRVFTFDMEDTKKYGWSYRPLFFAEDVKRDKKRKYDVSMISAIHSDRLKIYNSLKNNYTCLNGYFYLFERRLVYLKQKYINKSLEFTGVQDADINFVPLKLDETLRVYSDSNIIVDFTHPKQNGFTMRTIESIGSRCKLITNNKKILCCDFYDPQNIYVYDDGKFEIPDSFLITGYKELPEKLFGYYSINGWIKEMIE